MTDSIDAATQTRRRRARHYDVRLDLRTLIDPDALPLAYLLQHGEPAYDPVNSVLLSDGVSDDARTLTCVWSYLTSVGEHLVDWDLHGRYVCGPSGGRRRGVSVWFREKRAAVLFRLIWGHHTWRPEAPLH